jgi:hypothetical protein
MALRHFRRSGGPLVGFSKGAIWNKWERVLFEYRYCHFRNMHVSHCVKSGESDGGGDLLRRPFAS